MQKVAEKYCFSTKDRADLTETLVGFVQNSISLEDPNECSKSFLKLTFMCTDQQFLIIGVYFIALILLVGFSVVFFKIYCYCLR